MRELDDWQDRSLPADREAAQIALPRLARKAVQSGRARRRRIPAAQRLAPAAGYSAVGYTMNVHGTLKSLTNFLHEYYRSELLQQITRLQLRPDTNPAQLKISLQTEALILPGTVNEDAARGRRRTLRQAEGGRLR